MQYQKKHTFRFSEDIEVRMDQIGILMIQVLLTFVICAIIFCKILKLATLILYQVKYFNELSLNVKTFY